MSTPRTFNRVLRKELKVHAAWMPITNTFELGDYGVMSGGVFTKMGNISEFKVGFDVGTGPASKLDFKSESAKIIKATADGEVTALPEADIDAKITMEFSKKGAIVAKASLTSNEMQNIAQVARQLKNADDWRRKYRVVRSTYHAESCVIVSSTSADQSLELSGKASDLAGFDVGSVSAGVSVSSSSSIGLEIVGSQGIIGLGLFKLRFWGGGPAILNRATDDVVEFETEDDWDDEIDDDV